MTIDPRMLALSLTLALPMNAAFAQDRSSEPAEEPPVPELTVEEVVVVTASRAEQRLHEVPATMTVLSSEEIEAIPADDYGDVLRNVPGLNVAQMSARDVQVTGRQATSTLAADQLVLLDGRTIYLDFFGFVIWDFLPISPREIKQIEVVRGPGSAVWGANAMTGVINVITKPPREMAGTSVLVGAGELATRFGSVTHAGARDKLGYKVSGAYYEQDQYERPTGTIPGTDTAYPSFTNQGTEQPKLDLRFDYDTSQSTTWSFSGGWASTDGIIHTGIGPFDIDRGSSLSYAKASWTHRAMQLNLFANILDGDATNLLTIGAGGQRLLLAFQSDTYNLDFNNTSVLGGNHILTYGASARTSDYDLSIAPRGENRDEYGLFLQDEILIGDHLRWVVGGRWDNIDPIGDVFTPRTTLLVSPTSNHTLRLSYNQAYRAPSLIENFLDITIVTVLPLPGGDFLLPTRALGNPSLVEEQLEAFELGYVGTLAGRHTLTLSLYRNESERGVDFFPARFYSSDFPPPGWPLPPELFDLPILRDRLPAVFGYRNVAELVNEGVEASLTMRPDSAWSWFVNYSYQERPEVTGIPADEVNLPPEHRFNLGGAYTGRRFSASANVNHVDDAFWTDVLDESFHGPTDAYTQVNLSLGVRFADDRLALTLTGQNIFDERVQQHVFGDLISRKWLGQLRFDF